MIFRTSTPALDTDSARALEQLLAYTEELRRELEAKLTSIDHTVGCIKEQIEKLKEVTP